MVLSCTLFIYGNTAFKNLFADFWPAKDLLMVLIYMNRLYCMCIHILMQEPVY